MNRGKDRFNVVGGEVFGNKWNGICFYVKCREGAGVTHYPCPVGNEKQVTAFLARWPVLRNSLENIEGAELIIEALVVGPGVRALKDIEILSITR